MIPTFPSNSPFAIVLDLIFIDLTNYLKSKGSLFANSQIGEHN